MRDERIMLSSRPNEGSGGICLRMRKIPRLVTLARDDKRADLPSFISDTMIL